MKIISSKLGKRIKEIREGKGIKQCQLAEMLEMEPSNLTRIENGKQIPKEENLEKIARLLDIEIKDLFDFGHKKTREEILKNLIAQLNSAETPTLEFMYKTLQNLNELK